MKKNNKKKYAVACVTSMGLRITPENRMAVHNSNRFLLQATSAESNVLNVTSSLGRECLALTRFVEGSPMAAFIKAQSPMAAFIKAQLRARNIAYEAKEVPQGGPWGYRHQFNIADSGFGLRAPRVWNDRAGEVGRTLDPKDYDVKRIFGEEGVEILHLSGLIAAMSPETTKCCLAIAKAAKKYGTLVSFDLNYRATFWKGREASTSTTAPPSGRDARPSSARRSTRSPAWPTSSWATRRTSSSASASRDPRPAARTSRPRSSRSRR